MCLINFRNFSVFLFLLFKSTISPRAIFSSSNHLYVHYYGLVSDPSQCIEVYTAYPINPNLLRIVTFFKLHHVKWTKQPLTKISERYYFKITTPCASNFGISNMKIKFQYMNLQISIFTTTEFDSQIANFDYVFKSDINNGMIELLDTYSNFAINVWFTQDGQEYIPQSIDDRDKVIAALKTVNDFGTRICVVSPYAIVVEFAPEILPGHMPKGIITHMSFRYTSSMGVTEWRSYKAWDCSESQIIGNMGLFIRDELISTFLETNIRSFDYDSEAHYERPFQIPEQMVVKFEDSHALPKFSKVFLMLNKPDLVEGCTNGQLYVYKTAKNTIYWVEKWLESHQNGLVMREWAPVNPNQLF